MKLDNRIKNVYEFAKNYQSKHNTIGVSNIYLIETYDVEGNKTSESYGMNLMTDYGFKCRYSNGTAFPQKVYVGEGTDTSFDKTSSTMLSVLFSGLVATTVDTTIYYNFPMFYSKGENLGDGLITTIAQFIKVKYPFNITGISDDTRITEYGIGESYDKLWTHSFVYDIKGDRTSVIKKPNEELYITIFFCCSYYENLIINNYENNIYTVMTTANYMFNGMYPYKICTFKRDNVNVSREISANTKTAIIDSSITNVTTASNFTVTDSNEDAHGYIDGWGYYTDGFLILEPQYLDTPETFTLSNLHSLKPMNEDGFSLKFGDKDCVPITQMDVTSVKLFNHKTNAWDNNVTYYNSSDHIYDETPMSTTFAKSLYYSNNDEISKLYVYQNIRPNDPIVKLNTSVSTVYATDKYWISPNQASNDWIFISDFNNIPTEARTKRYWITNTNQSNINPIRQSGYFYISNSIDSSNSGFTTYSQFATTNRKYGSYALYDNYENGFYVQDNVVFVPNKGLSFTVGNSGSTSNDHMGFGRWLITINSSTSFYATDMSGVSTTGTTPTPLTMTPEFTTSTNLLTQCYRTDSTKGIVCLHSLKSNQVCILDLRNDTVSMTMKDSKMSCAIWGTTRVAYIPTDVNEIRIYDTITSSDVLSIPFPEGVTTVSFMYGHTNYVWFTDGSTYSYVIDISGSSISACVNVVNINSNLPYTKMTAVDDLLILYRYDTTSVDTCYYIRTDSADNVKNPQTMKDFAEKLKYNNGNGRMSIILRYVQNKTLAMFVLQGWYKSNSSSDKSGMAINIYDIGQYLNDKTMVDYQEYGNNRSIALYGENVIYNGSISSPMINWMPIEIKGTTKTISAVNTYKRIENKQWSVQFTNSPVFIGKPPGKQN